MHPLNPMSKEPKLHSDIIENLSLPAISMNIACSYAHMVPFQLLKVSCLGNQALICCDSQMQTPEKNENLFPPQKP